MKRIFIYLLVSLVIIFMLTPIYLMVRISLSPPQEILKAHPGLIPQKISFEHWEEVLRSGNIIPPLRKSLLVAIFCVALSLLLCIPAAYSLSRFPLFITTPLLLFIFLSRMIPEIELALPISIQFIRFGLLDTELGLTLAHTLRVLPIVVWILVSGFKAIPRELEEAAQVDGCSKFQGLRRIILPLALPAIGVAAIFGFLNSWDEFTYALYLCFFNKTLPLTVYYYVERASFFSSATYALIVTVPVIIATYALQRYLRSEYLTGVSQKG